MPRKSGPQMMDKYRKNMQNALPDIKLGIETTDKDQAALAIAAIPRMKENLIKAIDAGKVAEGLVKSGHGKWKRNAIEKGLNKIVTGIDANKAEIVAVFEKVSQIGEEVKNQIASMPKGDIEASINRVRANMMMQKAAWGKE